MKKTDKGLRVFGDRETHLCVCGNEAQTHRYTISVSTLGEVDLTVKVRHPSSPRRALCRIQLLPVTRFGGHMDVNC